MMLAIALAFIGLRLWVSPNLGTDDVEQALMAQDWRLVYNPAQPELYTWLLLDLYAVLGPGLLPHLLLKYGLVYATFAGAYHVALRWTDPRNALLAAGSLLLLQGFAWSIHAGVTHSALLSALMVWSLYALMRLVDGNRWDYAVLFGLLAGLGLQSKYSYIVFLVCLLAAAALDRDLRRRMPWGKLGVALLLAALLFAPHGHAVLTAPRPIGATLAELGQIGVAGGYTANLLAGLSSLAQAAIVFLFPFIVVGPALLSTAWRKAPPPLGPWPGVILRAAALGLVLLAASVIGAETTYFKDRRMHAILLLVPVAGVALASGAALAAWRRTALGALYIGVLVVAAAGLIGQAVYEPRVCRNCRLQVPLDDLADTIRAAGFTRGSIIAADEHLGGNLRIRFADAWTTTPPYHAFLVQPGRDDPRRNGACLLVWNTRSHGAEPPRPMVDLARGLSGLPPDAPILTGLSSLPQAPQTVSLPLLRYARRSETFAFLTVPGFDGTCRPRD